MRHEDLNEEAWENEVSDFLFANYNFELFHAARFVRYGDCYCNMIKFPKAENGRLVSKFILDQMMDAIIEDPSVYDMIFGVESLPIIMEDQTNFYIIWNATKIDEYESIPQEEIDALYAY